MKIGFLFLFVIASPIALGAPCDGAKGSMHKNPDGSQGGFVASTAKVSATVFVDPSSSICEQAKVQGNVKIKSSSWVAGSASIEGNSEINSSRIYGLSKVYGKAQVVNSAVCQASDINFKVSNSDYYCQTDDPEPRDPGELGKKTMIGVDSDVDGVRDDVEIWINNTTSNTPKKDLYNLRMALRQSAVVKQKLLIYKDNQVKLEVENNALRAATKCLIDLDQTGELVNELSKQMYNTIERLDAYIDQRSKLSGRFHTAFTDSKFATCSFKLRR